jgi:WD40 repeat protein
MTFDGFISYSHAADGRLAPAVQRGLHRLAKPWHRRRALWIFRDQTGLSVTPTLWTSIQQALDGSEHFVLLASPEAAASPWVNKEIRHWVATKSPGRILPVVTDGEWRWDPARGDFTEDSTAVPAALRGVFAEEPLYLDLRWARNDVHLSLRHGRFRDAIAQLAAPMHGVSKDELEGEDVRQHRRARRLWSVAAGALTLLAFVAVLTGLLAVRNADRANAAATEARRQAQLVVEQRGSAERYAEQARQQETLTRQQEARVKEAAQEVRRQEGLAREQETLAARASTEAGRQQANARYQRALADAAAARAREQEALADQQRTAARRSAEEARRQKEFAQKQEARAQEQQQRARTAGEEARRQEKKAREAADEAGRQQRTAISQRLVTQARTTIDDDPRAALRLALSAERVKPDAGTRGALTGLVTSTHFAGRLKGAIDVAYGPDGLVALTTTGGAVSLWDVTDPVRPAPLSTIDDLSYKVSLSPDGRTLGLVTDNAAVLWDVRHRTDPRRVGTLPTPARDIVFSPDGRTVAVGGETTTLWDVTGGIPRSPLAVLPDVANPKDLLFSPDGRTLVLPRTGEAWNVSDRAKPSLVARLSEAKYDTAAVSRRSPVLAAKGTGDRIEIWDMSDPAQPSQRHPVTGYPASSVYMLALDPTGTLLAVADGNRNLTFWNVTGPAVPVRVHRITLPEDMSALEFSPDGRRLIGAAHGGTTVWSTATAGAPAHTADLTPPDTALAMAYRAKGRQLVTVDRSGTAITWDTTRAHREIRRTRLDLPAGYLLHAAMTPDGSVVATTDGTGRVTLFDVTRPDSVVTLGGFDVPNSDIGAPVFSPDGHTLAVSGKRALRLWNVRNRKHPTVIGTLDAPTLYRAPVAFSPDGRIAAVPNEGTVTLVDVSRPSAPAALAQLPSGWEAVKGLAFSPDGRTLAAGVLSSAGHDVNSTVMLWDVTRLGGAQHLATMPTPVGAFADVLAFAPDGRTLAAGVRSATVMLWDVTDRTAPIHVAVAKGSYSHVSTLRFSPDARTLAVAGDKDLTDGAVALWDYSELNAVRADPVAFACAVTGRGLNADEWARYVPELPYRRSC